MTQSLKIECLVTDLTLEGEVASFLVTKEQLTAGLSKKADLVDGKIKESNLPDFIANSFQTINQKLVTLEESIADGIQSAKDYSEAFTNEKLIDKADLVDGKVPQTQLPSIEQYEGLSDALNGVLDQARRDMIERTDEIQRSKADLGEDGKVVREQLPNYDKIPGLETVVTDLYDSKANVDDVEMSFKESQDQLDAHSLLLQSLGSILPYNPSNTYSEGYVTLKDGSLQQLVSGKWVPFRINAINLVDLSGESQQQVNYNGGSKWHYRDGGYQENERAVLDNGDIVKSAVGGNVNDPNSNMTGWLNIGNTGEVESIADLLAIPNPKNGSLVFVKAYRGGWAAETIYHGPKGGGMFAYNSTKSTVNDGVHCFNGWERIDYDKYYVNTDIAGFYGDGTNDDFISFMRVNKYIISLDFWTPKTFEMMGGNFLVSSFTDECIIVPEYGITTLCTVTGNMTIKGQGKDTTKITYGFDYLSWMYNRFTTNYELNAGLDSNPLHCTFSPNKNYVSHIKGINIESFSVDLKGDVYYYNQTQADKAQNEGKAFCSISPISWALNTIENIYIDNLKIIRNPSMQNIAFNNSMAYTGNVLITGTEHEYCGEASSLMNKCPDHSSIYCNGKYTKITGSKFTSSRASTINCAIEFHGNGEVSDNEFIDCAAPLYAVNLQGYFGGTFNEYFDTTEVTIKDNKVRGAIYGIGYANGGKMTLNINNNNIKLRKEKANSTWVNGKVYVHGGLDARGLINLNETENSYTKVIGSGNTFEQEEATDWTTQDKYINSCIATKNIQELTWTNNTFINFKGSAVVLERPSANGLLAPKPKLKLSKNTYINCGSEQDSLAPHLVTDAFVYISNANILDFNEAAVNTGYGELIIENETLINCKYKRVISQHYYNTLFSKVSVDLQCTGTFLTPVKFANPYDGVDSFADYNFNMEFGKTTPSIYGFGETLKGYRFILNYNFVPDSTDRLYMNTCIKVKNSTVVSTKSDCINYLSIPVGDKPNGISISDRDAVYFPFNRSGEVQKVNYNSSTGSWA